MTQYVLQREGSDWMRDDDAHMGKPGPNTEVIREGWFYLRTYFQGVYGDAHREPENRSPVCTLLVLRAQLRRGPSGKVESRTDSDGLLFADEDSMLAWIDAREAEELPEEADGHLGRYVPEGFRRDDARALTA